MFPQQLLIKQLRQALPAKEIQTLLQAILEALPVTFTIQGKPVRKSNVRITRMPGIDGILLLDSQTQSVLLGQVRDGSGYSLISPLSEEEYRRILLQSFDCDSPAGRDLHCYHLLPQSQLTGSTDAGSSSLAYSELQNPIPVSSTETVSILQEHPGFLFFQHHLDAFSWQYVIQEIEQLEAGDVDFFYLELPEPILAPVFQLFNQTGDAALLRKHLSRTELSFPELDEQFIQLSIRCYQKRIQIVPVDCIVALDASLKTVQKDEIARRDRHMVEGIRSNQARHRGTKFLGLFGLLHSAMASELSVPSAIILPTPDSPIVPGSKLKQFSQETYRYCEGRGRFHSLALSSKPAVDQRGESERKTMSCARLCGTIGLFALTGALTAVALLASSATYRDDDSAFRP